MKRQPVRAAKSAVDKLYTPEQREQLREQDRATRRNTERGAMRETRRYADPIRHAAKVARARAEAELRRPWSVDEAEREAERESRRVGEWKPVGNMVRKTREQEAREERADRERIARRSEGR